MARDPDVTIAVTIEREVSPTGGRNPRLDALLEQARNHIMTDEEREAQRQSWVRGEKGMGNDAQEAADRERWVRDETTRGLTIYEAKREWAERRADRIADLAAEIKTDKSLWLRVMRRVAAFLWRRYGL